ncbi:helix-turn-helix domain-containing protein [Nonomuraea sp. NPDC048901]|uniref:helix-turn-helix domain-containing protein n=1 Tax=Nonomuraea sp. NPDC048901 TaxID=3155627 RepID=UPI0033C94905
MNDQPTPYPELAEVLTSLPILVREMRRARGLSQRAAAEQIGVSFSTVSRLENGEDLVMSNASRVLCWLDSRSGLPDRPNSPQPVQTPGDGGASAVNRTDTKETR